MVINSCGCCQAALAGVGIVPEFLRQQRQSLLVADLLTHASCDIEQIYQQAAHDDGVRVASVAQFVSNDAVTIGKKLFADDSGGMFILC